MELEKGCNRQKLFDLRQYHNKVDILLTFGIAFSSSLRACLGAIRSSVLTDILLNSSSHWALISWAFWIRASVVSRQAGLKVCKWAEMASAANFASPQIPMSISVIVNWTILENHQLYIKQKRFKKIAWIWSHHLYPQWKFKLLSVKFTWGKKAKYCWVMRS